MTSIGAGVVAQRARQPLAMLASHIGVTVRVLAALLLIQFAANAPARSVDDGPSAWVTAAHVRDPDGVLASGWPSSAHCSHLQNEPKNGRPIFLYLSLLFFSATVPGNHTCMSPLP